MNAKFFDNWTKQLRKGLLELCILNDIRNRKMYGYEIARKFCKNEGLIISESAIYTVLSRLKRQGLVKTFTQKSPDGPPRKHYKLTQQGKDIVCRMSAYWDAIKNQTGSIEKGPKRRRT